MQFRQMPQRSLTDLFPRNLASQYNILNTCGKQATTSKVHGNKEVSGPQRPQELQFSGSAHETNI